MGIMNTIFGNVSEMDIASLQKEFGALLCEGERIERAYKLIRDKWVFTNKRLIIQDVQGVTGKKREYLSVQHVPFSVFSKQTVCHTAHCTGSRLLLLQCLFLVIHLVLL